MTPPSGSRPPTHLGYEITILTSDRNALSKTISLIGDELFSDSSSCWMSSGGARRQRITGSSHLVGILRGLAPNEAIALGRLASSLPAEVQIRSKANMPPEAPSDVITRSGPNLVFERGLPAYALLDVDLKGIPAAAAMMADLAGGYDQLLLEIFPFLKGAACVVRESTSSCITNVLTGETYSGSGGLHIYVPVADGADIGRAIGVLHDRLWLKGYGWHLIGAAGQLLERSIIDRSVAASERLVFEGAPIVIHPLVQDVEARLPRVQGAGVLDTRLSLPDLSQLELAKLEKLKREARRPLTTTAASVKQRWGQSFAKKMSNATGMVEETCVRLVAASHEGHLTAMFPLHFDSHEIGVVTVADVLADVSRFEGETLADPLEGVSYGVCKAKVMLDDEGWPFIHSFAHGRQIYSLRHDATSFQALLEDSNAEGVVDRFIALLKCSILASDELAKITALVAHRAEVPIPSVNARVKAERGRLTALINSKRCECSADGPRLVLEAPAADAELTPVLRDLDRALASGLVRPEPMRNSIGQLVCIRELSADGLHQLSGDGSDHDIPLPAPPEPRIVPLDTSAATLLIEQHVEYQCPTSHEGTRLKRLQQPFVDAYRNWPDGSLPVVRAVVTAPVVDLAGKLVTVNGLDRESGILYRISPELLNVIPGGMITDDDALAAWAYLTEKWLCDVATDLVGKSVAVAYALTLIERVLLPERPAFFFTAAQRAAGKTTLANMLVTAVQGRGAPAAAWTDNVEERRKALMAFMVAGVVTVVWDNIKRGSLLSCPHIEAILTAATHSDRVLGSTLIETVGCQTVLAFTGNNIAPRGDLSSRSLVCSLDVERPDPENRVFKHQDPIQWTRIHRAEILKALYTLLLWRSPNSEGKVAPTRFKTWWALVGRPIEEVAKLTGRTLSFGQLFEAVESNDEESDGTTRCYHLLGSAFGPASFTAAQVASLINGTGFTSLGCEVDEFKETGFPDALKEAIADAAGSPFGPGAIGAQQVAKKLQRFVDRPAALNDKVVQLRRHVDRQFGNRYELKEMMRRG